MTLKQNAITVAIAILFTTFILVTIDAFYERPQYEDYCDSKERAPRLPLMEKQNCTYEQLEEEMDCYDQEGMPEFDYSSGCAVFEKCNFCNKELDDAHEKYSNFIFLILAPLGALAIIFGVYYKIEFLGSGFMFSGIILMFYGTIQNFEDLNKFLKIFVIALELGLVLFIAYKKIIPEKKK